MRRGLGSLIWGGWYHFSPGYTTHCVTEWCHIPTAGFRVLSGKILTYWPMIFFSPQKVLLSLSLSFRFFSRRKCSLSLVFRVVLMTDVLLQLDHISGTTYLPVCEIRKSAAKNSGDNWRHSCLRRTEAHRDFFWLLHLINILTYLL